MIDLEKNFKKTTFLVIGKIRKVEKVEKTGK